MAMASSGSHCPSLQYSMLMLFGVACYISFVQTQTLCQDSERSALLHFTKSFTLDKWCSSRDSSTYPQAASWAQGENSSNCCSWDGVECDEHSGYVIGLNLSWSCLYGSFNSSSSLFKLVHLQRLDLSGNNFNSSELPTRFGHDLTSLTYVNLSLSSFAGQVPSEFSMLSKLTTLDLSSITYLNRKPIPKQKWLELKMSHLRSIVQNLSNIKHLHLMGVQILSAVPDILTNASSLVSLHLVDCGLYGEFPVGIFRLPNLEVLDLAYNQDLSGYFPEFNRSSHIKELNVAYTNFSGHIPASIGDVHSLTLLNLAYCNFYPHVPTSLRNLTQLGFLGLSFFFDHSYTFFDLSKSTYLNGQLSDSWSWIGKLTNLNHLGLAYTYLSGEFPCFLANLTELSDLNLGYNRINGQIPSCIVKLTKLSFLVLRFNNLQGAIPESLFELKNLAYLDLCSNDLNGQVELDQFCKLKNLTVLRLASNRLSVSTKIGLSATALKFEALALGSCNLTEFPDFLQDNRNLVELDLSDNNIHGQIPSWLWNSSSQSLRFLNLSYNSLRGFEQDPVIFPWWKVTVLELGSNRLQGSLPITPLSVTYYSVPNNGFTGEIPPSFCNLTQLSILDVSNNRLHVIIPQCLGNFSALKMLKMQNNSFEGYIPPLCPHENALTMIDLSYNQLWGKLPRSMVNCTQLEFLNVGNNQISDIFPSWSGELSVLRVLILRFNRFHGSIGKPETNHEFRKLCIIDLSDNGFSGMLPSNYIENWNYMKSAGEDEQVYLQFTDWIGCIDLSSNKFEGEIPSVIGNLRDLHVLRLSNNSLSGFIPSSLGHLTALDSLDLSQNQLTGDINNNLAQLNFLAYFNVSHNNLQGTIPHGQQFDTFEQDSYSGNSALCGEPLSNKCEYSVPTSTNEEEHDLRFQIELDWYVVLPGVVSGLIVGVAAANTWKSRNQEWLSFVETFRSRRRRQRKEAQQRRQQIRPWSY